MILRNKKTGKDCRTVESSRYYMINEKTGYIITFDTKYEMEVFSQEVAGWREVKVILDGEKYLIERICKKEEK